MYIYIEIDVKNRTINTTCLVFTVIKYNNTDDIDDEKIKQMSDTIAVITLDGIKVAVTNATIA